MNPTITAPVTASIAAVGAVPASPRTRRAGGRDDLPVSCPRCPQRFADVSACLEHQRVMHADERPRRRGRRPTEDPARGYGQPPAESRFSVLA